ncbi:hypothetical protein [Streptomyces beihaiensis]|uniref:DUF2934 domain-containing protein n=1 Tax=Streptomyces beihaiensis TaxID=2984495 RepID=A0ABT3U1Y1_9ACTN|nr:hypothetical protein [Streptomyces beihaiensis]MCX3062716.1 hypothetical protein [Streptomyces beihaiensis]
MGNSQERWKYQSLIPTSRTPPDTPDAAPIYSSLMEEWRQKGLTLPNRYDEEWHEAVTRDHWPRPE